MQVTFGDLNQHEEQALRTYFDTIDDEGRDKEWFVYRTDNWYCAYPVANGKSLWPEGKVMVEYSLPALLYQFKLIFGEREQLWTASEFREWLQSKDSDDVVGVANTTDTCPVARWRRAQGDAIEVTDEGIWLNGWKYLCPEWVRSFIGELDMIGRRQCTARECLSILESIHNH